ncbi:MAG: glycosyltransferase family 39 protein [Acidimicrobiales bacterium]
MTRPAAPVAWKLVLAAAAAKVALQLSTANFYGAHRDEFYYLASGQHPAWGYVDNPPLVPWLYRLQEMVFGHSVVALAVVPALLGGVYVVLAAGMTADLGGRRPAQTLAVCVAWLGPIYLTTSHFLSTASLDLVWWALASWLVIHLVRTGDTRWWVAVGAVVGAGLLTKDTIVFWALAAALGLLSTPQRALLRSRWLAVGACVAGAIVAPNVAWQVSNHWPTLQFLGNLRAENSSSDLRQFVPLQLAMVTLAGTVVWVVALRVLRRRPEWHQQRWLAHGYIAAFIVLFALAGKAYYLGSWYLPLVAVGATAIEASWSPRRRRYLLAAVLATGLVTAPLFTPLLPADVAVSSGITSANTDLGGMLGWRQVVGQISAVLHGLPARQQRSAVIFTEDYSEAGAVDFYGRALGLPAAISGHNTFWLWGYGHPAPGATVVAVGLESSFVHRYWSSVTLAATLGTGRRQIDPQERGAPVWVCRDLRVPWAVLWPAARHYN